jgi:signal transduction histidine kinase/DNA-binding response OmpR family regulator
MAKQNEKILVVDSDAEVIDLVAQQVLVPQGYQVATALDGSSALQKALKLAPDIIITSLELPGLSGRDLLAALRTQGFQAIVIATGPKGSETHALQAIRLGAKDYLTKPIREAELVASLDHALEELRLRREREQLSQKLSAVNQQLERRVKELTTLYGIGKAVTAVTDLSQLFDRLIEGALFVTEAEVGWLLLTDEGSGKLILRGAKNIPPLSGIKLHQPWDDGLSSLLMLSGEGITIAGEPLAKMRAGQVVKAAVAVPIKAKEQVMGVIAVGNKSGKPFIDRDQAMLSAVADYASIALVNARLFQAMEAKAHSLQKEFETLAQGGQQKEEMVMRLARELRTPLLQARNALDDVVRGKTGPLNPNQTGLAQAALERLNVAQRLVEDMNILSETANRPPNPRPAILADIAKQSLARIGVEAKQSGVALVAEFPSEPLRVAADVSQIGRVFENLLGNAIKFSPQGGQITVRLRDVGNGSVEVAISDQGVGIPSDKLSHIWDKYYQVDEAGARKHGGVGLGLSVVKQVVEAHGGKVWVESQLGKGSTFHFSLVKL